MGFPNKSNIIAKLLAVLMFTLRGTPFVYQGDEIGMRNADFRSIDEIKDIESLGLYAELVKTVSAETAFRRVLSGTRDHARVPVPWDEIAGQRDDDDSIWNFYRRLIAMRRDSPALVYGKLDFIRPRDKTLFAYTRELSGVRFYVEANLGTRRRKSRAPSKAEPLACNYREPSRFLRAYEARVYGVGQRAHPTARD